MLAAVLLGQEDSTGQRITFIVIGLLLAALFLAILTAWYYRVTDPGPRERRRPSGATGAPGGGVDVDPRPRSGGPGWRKRLSGFSVPASDTKPSNSGPSQPQRSIDEPAMPQRAPGPRHTTPAGERGSPNVIGAGEARDAVEPRAVRPAREAPETVSLEGGYYLDLTDAPKSPAPSTNVGSLNSLDLRQPAPLVEPGDQGAVPVPTVPEPQASQQAAPSETAPPSTAPTAQTGPPAQQEEPGLSFDEWLAGVEAIEDQ